MHRYPLVVVSAALAAGLQLVSSSAFAHIELQAPMNRYSDIKQGDNKSCPCGSGTTNRSCRKPEELSDPDRSADRITTFAPGDTITVRFDEYVGHGGRYRIAFDPDGADLDDFNENILLDEPDPSGSVGNIGDKSMWEFQVELPDMTCDNCTLQLIQVMDGNTTDPVLNPVDRGGTYFQCADLILANGTPPGGIAPVDPSEHLGQKGRPLPIAMPTADATDTNANTGSMMMPVANAMGSTGNARAAMGAASDNSVSPIMDSSAEEGGGCSMSGVPSSGNGSTLAALSSVLVAWALRSRRNQRVR